MEVVVITDLATEPVTVQEAKNYMRISNNEEDTLIGELITSARQRLEGFTNRSFGTKTLKVRWNELNGWQELPYSPIQSITSVVNDDLTALTYESKGLEVKQIEAFSFDGVIVQYVAGFTTLPKALKEAILKEVSTSYENRENYILADSATILSNEAKMLASRFSRNTLLGF
jgi:uncharacterized phiE125 gp8 family phage protein